MAGLAGYRPPRAQVPLPTGGHLDLRGLSTADLVHLVALYREDVLRAAQAIQANAGAADLMAWVASVQTVAPALIGMVIALACDEPDEAMTAAMLPPSVQIDALRKIWGLTFAGSESLPKVIGTLRHLVSQAGLPTNGAGSPVSDAT